MYCIKQTVACQCSMASSNKTDSFAKHFPSCDKKELTTSTQDDSTRYVVQASYLSTINQRLPIMGSFHSFILAFKFFGMFVLFT